MKTAEQILTEAYTEHKPSLVIASYSGGYDSMVMTHKTVQWAKVNSIPLLTIAVDTRLHADGWRDFVMDSSKQIGVTWFEIWQTVLLDKWVEDVKERGFAYRDAQHKIYFYYLKQNAFRQIIAHYKQHQHDRIMFVTGVRRLESRKRANTPEYSRNGAGVWCNPLVYWNEFEVQQYRIDHNLPENPFYHQTHNSGDCLCNWHTQISYDDLQKHGTEAARIINPLHEQCLARFGYGYGQEPSKLARQEIAGQMPLFDLEGIPNLCAGCERPKASQDDIDTVMLQRMEW